MAVDVKLLGDRATNQGLGAQGEVTAEREVEVYTYTTRKLGNMVALHGAIDVCDGGIGIPCSL